MASKQLTPDRQRTLLWQWVGATTVGWLAAPAIALLGLLMRQPLTGFAIMLFAGFVAIGLAQWLVLRNHLTGVRLWVFTGFLPGLVGGAIVASQPWSGFTGNLIFGMFLGILVLTGGLLGLVQGWILKTALPSATHWAMVHGLAWFAGLIVGSIVTVAVAIAMRAGGGLERVLWGILLGVSLGWLGMGLAIGLITSRYLIHALTLPATDLDNIADSLDSLDSPDSLD